MCNIVIWWIFDFFGVRSRTKEEELDEVISDERDSKNRGKYTNDNYGDFNH